MLWMITLLGCITHIVDRVTVDRVVGFGKEFSDTQKPCALGESLGHVLLATQSFSKKPELAMVIANGTSGICAQQRAWEERLRLERAKVQRDLDDPFRIAEIRDAQYAAERYDRLAAYRFQLAYNNLENAYGELGGDCPTIKEKDEVVYLIGLISGTFAVLHDKQSGGQLGVPLDLLPKIARSSRCLNTEKWWYVPQALRAGIWANVPGSGPVDVDNWATVEQAATMGGQTGVRVAYGIATLLAANAGQDDFLQKMLVAHGNSVQTVPTNPDWAFFDQYATEVSLFQSDVLWTSAKGHRSPRLGQLPVAEEENTVLPSNNSEDDPFE